MDDMEFYWLEARHLEAHNLRPFLRVRLPEAEERFVVIAEKGLLLPTLLEDVGVWADVVIARCERGRDATLGYMGDGPWSSDWESESLEEVLNMFGMCLDVCREAKRMGRHYAAIIRDHPEAFALGFEEGSSGVGVTFGDPDSPRSVAYDLGRSAFRGRCV
jgi:hypothetical protein